LALEKLRSITGIIKMLRGVGRIVGAVVFEGMLRHKSDSMFLREMNIRVGIVEALRDL
jgi:hypothetical protein